MTFKKAIEALIFSCFSFAIYPGLKAGEMPASLPPPDSPVPRINGPGVFGVRPGSPVLYTVPAPGDRPMRFSADGLPGGLILDAGDGQITAQLKRSGIYLIILHATNDKGMAEKKLRIVVGNEMPRTG